MEVDSPIFRVSLLTMNSRIEYDTHIINIRSEMYDMIKEEQATLELAAKVLAMRKVAGVLVDKEKLLARQVRGVRQGMWHKLDVIDVPYETLRAGEALIRE